MSVLAVCSVVTHAPTHLPGFLLQEPGGQGACSMCGRVIRTPQLQVLVMLLVLPPGGRLLRGALCSLSQDVPLLSWPQLLDAVREGLLLCCCSFHQAAGGLQLLNDGSAERAEPALVLWVEAAAAAG